MIIRYTSFVFFTSILIFSLPHELSSQERLMNSNDSKETKSMEVPKISPVDLSANKNRNKKFERRKKALLEISGRAYWDANENSTFEDTEDEGLGISLSLVDPGGEVTTFTTSDNGLYSFTYDGSVGNYTLMAVEPTIQACGNAGNMDFEFGVPDSGKFDFVFEEGMTFQQDFTFLTEKDSCNTITGRVFWDKNNNGIYDDSIDAGLQSNLTLLNNTIGSSVVHATDSDGFYSIVYNTGGYDYTLWLPQKPVVSVCNNSGTIELDFGNPDSSGYNFISEKGVALKQDFTFLGTDATCLEISGRAYWDKNEDNAFDMEEDEGLTLQLSLVDGSGATTTFTTSDNGLYSIVHNGSVGNYSLMAIEPLVQSCGNGEPINFEFGNPTDGKFDFVYEEGMTYEQDFTLLAAEDSCNNISGRVYWDKNDNGVYESSVDEGILTTLTLTNDLTGNAVEYLTDADGLYSVEYNTDAQSYRLKVNKPSISVCDDNIFMDLEYGSPDSASFAFLSQKGVMLEQDFTFLGADLPCLELDGRVYWDKNNNNVFDGEDEGVTVSLSLADDMGGSNTFTTTDNGLYSIVTNGSIGNYSLMVIDPMVLNCEGTGFLDVDFGNPEDGALEFVLQNDTAIQQDFTLLADDEECKLSSGRVYLDLNENGVFDNGEEGIEGAKIFTVPSGYSAFTDANGVYTFSFSSDRVEEIGIDISGLSHSCGLLFNNTQPDSGFLYSINTGMVNQDLNFGLTLEEGFESGLYSLFVEHGNEAGKKFYSFMDFKSCGANAQTCTLRLEHDTLLTLINSSLTPNVVGEDFKEWYFGPNESPEFYCMQMLWRISNTAESGHILHWEASYECPPYADPSPENNLLVRDVEVLYGASRYSNQHVEMYSMRPEGVMPEVLENDQLRLSYLVSFENIAHSGVYDMVIIDTLPNELDGSSVEKSFSSLPHHFFIVDSSILIWQFSNVYLSSTHEDELNSYGFVQFNVSLKDGLHGGTIINNKAHVILNHGSVDVTNEIVHRLASISDINESTFSEQRLMVYPNPSKESINVQILGQYNDNYQLKIYDVSGSIVYEDENIMRSAIIEIGNWSKGIYFLQLFDEQSNAIGWKKLVKM